MIFTDFSLKQKIHIRTGSVDIWFTKNDNELLISHEYSNKKLKPQIDNKSKLKVENNVRIISEINSDRIKICPVVPDMPVIVQFPDDIVIPEKQSAVFYVEIPLVLQIKIKSAPDIYLTDIPSERLSKTWYGDLSGGILSYSLNTVLSTVIPDEIPPSSAVSRILIINKSNRPFNFKKTAVYVHNFNIYQGSNNMLWTNNSSITLLNNDELKIQIDEKPSEGEKAVYINPNYVKEKNLFKKGFTIILKTVTGE